MSLKIENNPIDILLEAFEENYPEVATKINKISFVVLPNGCSAVTKFTDKGMDIFVSAYQAYSTTATIDDITVWLIHELAHAIVGAEEGHTEKWQEAFSELQKRYYERIRKEAKNERIRQNS